MKKNKWFNSKGYKGHQMSKRAATAFKRGEVPLYAINKQNLVKAHIPYNPHFIKWLCTKHKVRFTSKHHVGYPPRLHRFYDLDLLHMQLESLNIEELKLEWEKEKEKALQYSKSVID